MLIFLRPQDDSRRYLRYMARRYHMVRSQDSGYSATVLVDLDDRYAPTCPVVA